ncbi:MAG: SufS family cysteine desulfurase [Bacteroidales bacterium]|jgi:cysteine desulfurase/selenocysteine lyase|nr:SufS family cysteine desulfurase [Bacteroidales bacterium]
MTQSEIEKIRKDFPILQEKIYGKPLVYLDNAATTQKPNIVINTISEFYQKYNSNVHRGAHFLSNFTTEALEKSRTTVQKFINADSVEEIIFTRGTTESINLVSYSFGELLQENNEIIISEMEHHSNFVPWQLLAERKKCHLKLIHFNDKGILDTEELYNLITDKTKLVAITAISNVLGTVNPIKEIITKIRKKNRNTYILIDGAQLVAHSKTDVKDLDCDFLAFSAHKLYGPTGIGILYGKKEILKKMPPFQSGGEMISSVSFEKTNFNILPYKFEAGTPNYIDAIAFAKAIEYVNIIGPDKIHKYENSLLEYATEKIKTIEDLKIFGTSPKKSGVLSFNCGKIHHGDIGTLLDKMGIAIRTGTHCAEPIMQHFDITGTARVSFSFYNTFEEIDIFINALKKAVEMLK